MLPRPATEFQFLVDDLHEDAVAFTMEDAYLFFTEQECFVEEMVQHVECLFGTVAAEVERGVEMGTFLVHLVVDATADADGFLVGGNLLLCGASETLQRNGHAEAVAFHDGFLPFDFHHLTEGVLTVDADDTANGDRRFFFSFRTKRTIRTSLLLFFLFF